MSTVVNEPRALTRQRVPVSYPSPQLTADLKPDLEPGLEPDLEPDGCDAFAMMKCCETWHLDLSFNAPCVNSPLCLK